MVLPYAWHYLFTLSRLMNPTNKIEGYIWASAESGRYENASEILRAAPESWMAKNKRTMPGDPR